MASLVLVVARPITVAPEVIPACRPWKESSNTYEFSGVAPNISIPSRKQSGSGFRTGKHFSGQDAVYHSFKFGMGVIDVLHLLFVGAGYNGYFLLRVYEDRQ